jgi:hypothetical protein
MLVATFGPSTTWVGKTVTYADGAFVLEGHGPISAQDVFEYERQGHLEWAMDGVRAWVGAKAQAEGGPTPSPTPSGQWQQEHTATIELPDTEVVELQAADDAAVRESQIAASEPKEVIATQAEEAPATWPEVAAILEPAGAEVEPEPAPSASQPDTVLAAEPADLAVIAAASAVALSAVDEPSAAKEATADPASEIAAGDEPAGEDELPSEASVGDAFAGLGADDPARARAIEEAARDHDWTRLAALYTLQAWWLDEDGRDALQVTRLARRAELRAFLNQGATLVRVRAADEDTCDACRRGSSRVMTIADALRLMPIPDASCAYKWCRCVWESAKGDESA